MAVAEHKEDEKMIAQLLNTRLQGAIQKGAADGTARRYLEHQARIGAPAALANNNRAAEIAAGLAQAQPNRMQQIGVFDRQGKVLSTLGEPGPYNQPALSPDGNR